MKLKKLAALGLVATLGVGLLAGCGKDGDSSSKSGKQVEITWWAFPTFNKIDDEAGKYERQLVEKFEKANPDIKVNVEMLDFKNGGEKLTTAIEGGTAPDVLFDAPGRIVDYGRAGKLVKMNDLIEANKLKDDITSESILTASGDQDGNYWMYPSSAAPFVMVVNKTYLEKEGLLDKVNLKGDRTWTTEQFMEVAKAMAAKGYKGPEIYSGGQGGDQGTRAFVTNLTGASVMDKDRTKYTIDSKEGLDAFKLVKQGIDEKWLEGNTSGVANDALDHFVTPVNAKFWACVLWSPNLAAQREKALKDANIEAVAVSLPAPEGKQSLEYLVNGYAIFDNKDQDKIEAAKKFVTWLSDDPTVGKENVKATSCFPVRKSFGDLYSGNEDMTYYNSLSNYYGGYYNTVPGFAEMRKFWWESLQALSTGSKSAEEAVKYFNENANKTLND